MDETAPNEFSVFNRLMAAVMVVAALGMVYVGLDIMAGGAITRALSPHTPPAEDE